MLKTRQATLPSAIAGFTLVDELIRTLVKQGTLPRADAVALLERSADAARAANLYVSNEVAMAIESMIPEYRDEK
jgi:hypothetical protein